MPFLGATSQFHEKKMGLDRRRRRRLDEFAPEFNRRVETMDVVDELGALLPDSAREAIQCALNQQGRTSANRELSKRVRSRDGWFEELITALKKCGGCDDLVGKLKYDKEGSLMTDSMSAPPPIFPNGEQAIEEQAEQFTKYCAIRPDTSKELTPRRYNQEAGSLENTVAHSENQENAVPQASQEIVARPSTYESNKAFPNKDRAMEEQATHLRKFNASVQMKPGNSIKLTSARNCQEKGTLESTALEKKRQENDKMQSYPFKVLPNQHDGPTEAIDSTTDAIDSTTDVIDSQSLKSRKELITSSVDEKEKDESDVGFDSCAVTSNSKLQQIGKSQWQSVTKGSKTQNDKLIDVGQQSDAAPPPNGLLCNTKFIDRNAESRSEMSKGTDALASCLNHQISYPRDQQQLHVHERPTFLVSEECDGQHEMACTQVEKKVDSIPNGDKRKTSGDFNTDDDTSLRFFGESNPMKENHFSKVQGLKKEILKDLNFLNAAGEIDLAKLKEFGEKGETGNSGNSYQPLTSDGNPPSINSHSSQEVSLSSKEVSLQISEESEGENHYINPFKSSSSALKSEHVGIASSAVVSKLVNNEEVNLLVQNNVEFTGLNQTALDKGTEVMGDSHPVDGNTEDVETMAVGHHQAIPTKGVKDKVINGVSVRAVEPAVSQEDTKDDVGDQDHTEINLATTGACKGGRDDTKSVKGESETPLILEEHCNLESEVSTENLRDDEMKGMMSSRKDEVKVEGKDQDSVNDTLNVCDYKPDEAKDINRDHDELDDASISEQGVESHCGSSNDVNSANNILDRKQQENDEDEATTEMSNGIIGKTVSMIGHWAAMMYGSQS